MIKIDRENTGQVLISAISILKNGGIIAYPTETFYGLGVRFDLALSLQNLIAIKKRPTGKALPLIIGNRKLLGLIASSVNEKTIALMDRFWPGPLTIILPAQKNLPEYLTAGTDTAAVRIPGRSFALTLARAAGFPITATSANISGMPAAQDAETVVKYFGDSIDLVIDGGKTPGGKPSTIADATGEDILLRREGAIEKEELYRFVGERG
jgi:L-threonylcarbamoyladenylate synthase